MALNRDLDREVMSGDTSPFKYDLTSEEYKDLLESMSSLVLEQNGSGVSTVWTPSDHPFSNLVRTEEAKIFPEIPELMVPYERVSAFLAIVDTRTVDPKLIHGFRISVAGGLSEHPSTDETGTKIALIQDIIQSRQGLTEEEFQQYYASQGIDLSKSVSVETNFRVGKKVEDYNGLPISQLGYIAVFQFVKRLGISKHDLVIFAHLNKPAISSLGAVGIEYSPIAGRADLRTPTVGDKKFDDDYHPVEIQSSKNNVEIFESLELFAAPSLYL